MLFNELIQLITFIFDYIFIEYFVRIVIFVFALIRFIVSYIEQIQVISDFEPYSGLIICKREPVFYNIVDSKPVV
jgi:hypothetical protein